MKCLVTGVAGFIGSHLAERLLEEGYEVVGVDCFTDFYPRWIKEKNLNYVLSHRRFRLVEADLEAVELSSLLDGVKVVFHLAAQAGVRTSWGKNFFEYIKNNIHVTQKLLEALRDHPLEKFIYASSSSVYGLTPQFPMSESSPVQPISPYGVTKLAAEQLCFLYHKNYGLPTLSLRFFTVYGPRQRPDMAFHKFFLALLKAEEIPIYGDGRQTRDFTFILDIVEANMLALKRGQVGETYNIGGGHQEELERVLPMMEEIAGKKVKIRWLEPQKGDVLHTLADITKARRDLGYNPQSSLREGLREEWEWIKGLYQ